MLRILAVPPLIVAYSYVYQAVKETGKPLCEPDPGSLLGRALFHTLIMPVDI